MKQSGCVVANLNDLHTAHPFAICPPKWELYDSNVFTPNPLQQVIRTHWLDCARHIGELRRGKRLVLNLVGEPCEGLHHHSVQIITPRQDEQEAMAIAVIEEFLALCKFSLRHGDKLLFYTGSFAHEGDGGASIERVARKVLDYDDDGRLTRDHRSYTLDGIENSPLFDVAHTPTVGPGNRVHTRGSSWRAALLSHYHVCLQRGIRPPDYVFRAHRHTYVPVTVNNYDGDTVMHGYMLPGWKGVDDYVRSKEPEALTYIGCLVADVTAAGKTGIECLRIKLEQDQTEVL